LSKKHITFVRGKRLVQDFFYRLVRGYAIFIARLTIKRMDIKGLDFIPEGKPVLFASTHFNSFFDSCITHLVTQPKVYALARGDAFNKPFVSSILEFFYILPVWRISEGKQNMVWNQRSFERCHEVFQENQKVLIYPEGVCKYQTEVLPLKNGTAAMAYKAWKDGLDVEVIPVTINYESYTKIGKMMNFNFGSPLLAKDFDLTDEKAFNSHFTTTLYQGMTAGVDRNFKPYSFFKNPLYAIFFPINLPLYLGISWLVKKKLGKTVFQDSVWFGLLMILWPVYTLLLAGIFLFIF
jgi:1-acyl-sn-glycerol-3-phosphate acyltransferase